MVSWRRSAKRRRQEIPPGEWREDLVLQKIYQEMQNIARPWRRRQALESVADGYKETQQVERRKLTSAGSSARQGVSAATRKREVIDVGGDGRRGAW